MTRLIVTYRYSTGTRTIHELPYVILLLASYISSYTVGLYITITRSTDTMTRHTSSPYSCAPLHRTPSWYIIVIIVHGFRYTCHVCIALLLVHVMLTCYTCMSYFHVTPAYMVSLYSCHMDRHAYYMYYCSMFPYSCYTIVSCYGYRYSWYWTCERLICDMWESHIYCSRTSIYCSCYLVHVIWFLIPVILFYAINRAQVQLSCYPYHV